MVLLALAPVSWVSTARASMARTGEMLQLAYAEDSADTLTDFTPDAVAQGTPLTIPPTVDTAPLPPVTGPLGTPTRLPLPSPLLNPSESTSNGTGARISDFNAYRLGPGDSIFVNVRRFPDLSFQATLDIQGNILVPIEGVVSLQGLTLQETEFRIAQIYNRYVVQPEVRLTLVAQRGVEVTILGEVVRPGYYPLGAPQISTALLSAGGTTERADLRSVVIQRRLIDGQVLEHPVDLFTPLQEGQQLPDVALQDGDVILVDRLDPSELDEYDSALVSRSTLAQPTIGVRLLNYGAGRGGVTSGNLNLIQLPNGSRFVDLLVRANLNPDTAKLKKIALVRFDEEAGKAITTTLNGNDAFRGDPSENPPLQNNDVIIINRTLAARVSFFLNSFTQPFRDVLGFLLFFDQLSDSASDLFGP